MNKTKVKVVAADGYQKAQKGDVGYIDGYIRGADDIPYAVVVFDDCIEMIYLHCLDPIKEVTNENTK